jgi:hypothetical protein
MLADYAPLPLYPATVARAQHGSATLARKNRDTLYPALVRFARPMQHLKVSNLLHAVAMVAATALIFSMSAWAQTENVLHDFTGRRTDGSDPLVGLTFDAAGNLYGVTQGTVYELSPNGSGGWTYNTIFTFTQGRMPKSPLTIDSAGNLYGATFEGGSFGNCNNGEGCGIVYELSQTAGVWSETVLYNFPGGSNGDSPIGNLAIDPAGNLYGTANTGGNFNCSRSGAGCGLVFELSPASSGWRETVLHAFADKLDGALPMGGVVLDAAGNVYGTTSRGGNIKDCPTGQVVGCGVVFKLTSSSSGWTEQVLHAFTENNQGYYAESGVVFDSLGNLYGTTLTGGGVFRLAATATGPWTFTLLKNLNNNGGAAPMANLTLDASGNIYGTTDEGGIMKACGDTGCGVVFKLTPTATGPWTESLMHAFTGKADGRYPFFSGVVLDSSGNLYGATEEGGTLTVATIGITYGLIGTC